VLPDTPKEEVLATLNRVVADEQVKITPMDEIMAGPPSPVRPDVFKAVARITDTMWAGVPTVPLMVMGATDGLYLRNAGIPTYGVMGFFIERDDFRAHGRDERLGVREFYEAEAFLYQLVKDLSQ
jgi:acetylornithine deacetylase/succinyl-diaminopimelate desuccinylase-like protein